MFEIIETIGKLASDAVEAAFQYTVALNHLRFGRYREARRALGSARVAFTRLGAETRKVEVQISETISSSSVVSSGDGVLDEPVEAVDD